MKRFAPLLLLLAACDTGWKPVSIIESLRVIGVRADPPEMKPGDTAQLEALILDPTRPGEKTTMIWLGCDPDPYGAGRGACGDLDALGDTTGLVDAMKLPEGVKLIGIGPRASYSTRADLFDVLPAGDDRRIKGTVGTIISMAIGADVPLTASMEELQPYFEKVQSKEIASQLTLFRVRISEADAANHNPVIDALLFNGVPVARGETLKMLESVPHQLDLTAHDFEEYDDLTPTGVERKTERMIVAWYTTAGRFDYDRVALDSDLISELTAPGDTLHGNDAVPADRRGRLWAVLRDVRGGQVWADWPWFVCDPKSAMPRVTSVEHSGSSLTLRGENLDQVLEVLADMGAVRGAYSPSSRTWVGDDVAGTLKVTGRNCLSVGAR